MAMGYEIALERAWNELDKISSSSELFVPFLNDVYQVSLKDRTVFSALQEPLRDDIAILVLHYLIGIQKQSFLPKEEWISFREIERGISFLPAYEETVIKPLVECFNRDPEGLIQSLVRQFGGRIVKFGDVAVEIYPFPEARVRIILWKGDEDIPSQATIIFDRGLALIYSTEDIAVLLQLLVQKALEVEG